MTKITDALDRFKRLQSERHELNRLWDEVAEVLAPERGGFAGRVDSRGKMFDSSPIIAKRGMVNAIGSFMRPKTAAPGKWYDIFTEDEGLMEIGAVKGWVDHAEGRLWSALYNPRAKFIHATGKTDHDTVLFGAGALFTGTRKDRGGLLFRNFHMRGAYIARNSDGDVDTVFVIEELTARQAEQRWGKENLGEKTREALSGPDKDVDRKFRFLWLVEPRHDRDPRVENGLNMPFKGLVIDIESEHKVLEEGFEEFPFAIPRWDADELYGRGIGVLALPDTLSLNQMGKTMLRGLHRAVAPPWLLPSDSMVNAPQLKPDGVTYYDAEAIRKLGLKDPFRQMESRGNIPWGLDAQKAMREQIFALFFRNVLNLPIDAPSMTATEVMQRREEFIREIGAVFGQLESDYTGPMVERAFNLMQRNGGFAPPPEELMGRTVNFRFASPIEKAKRQIEEVGVSEGINRILEVGQRHPEIEDRVNWDEYGKFIGASSDFPSSLILDNETVEGIREQRARAQQQAEEFAAAEKVIGGAAQVADIAGALG